MSQRTPRNRRFRLAVVAVAACLVAVLAACSSSGNTGGKSGSKTVTLTVWDQNIEGNLNTIYNNLAAQFDKLHPGVHVHRITTAFTEILQQQKLALSGSNPPDIVQSNQGYGTLGPEAAAHLIIPLTQYARQYHWASCQPSTILQGNMFTPDGKHFGSGVLFGASDVVGGPVALYYNKAKLAQLGVKLPISTLGDFENVLAKAKAAGQIPIEFGDLEQWPGIHEFQILLNVFAPNKEDLLRYIFGTGPATLNTPWALQAATTLQDWVKKGYFESGFTGVPYNSAATNFSTGTGVFLVSGPWLNGQLDAAMHNNVGVMLMPPLHAGQPPVATNSGNNAYVIAAKSQHQALAAEYLEFITCSKQASDFFLKNGQIPLYLPSNASQLVPAGSSTADWLAAWNAIRKDNGSIMFMDLSTVDGTTVVGQTVQELMGLRTTPQQAISAIETDYSQFHSSLGG
jgi:raffinose/stachyose/melibiose transport system substrate-binding protein